ncbi:MAG TPA: response regulator [Candidatus Omnitrophica bacterium]|nr:response regulator [Candidatus Omnitrophota bacterium]
MRKKVLLIDDEEDFCYFVKLNLEDTGKFEVFISGNGSEGIEIAKNEKPDIILLDLLMPVMDGSEVAEHLLRNETTKKIPIVFVTALTRKKEIDSHSGTIGGRIFLAKPVTPQELIQCIERVLEKK